VSVCEGHTKAGFEIALKLNGTLVIFEGEAGNESPWAVLGGVFGLAGVVGFDSDMDVGCAANVSLLGNGNALE
jgi:hypothetical protein